MRDIDIFNSVPVKEVSDGVYQEDNFDIFSAVPVSTLEQEVMEKPKPMEIHPAIKADWEVLSNEALAQGRDLYNFFIGNASAALAGNPLPPEESSFAKDTIKPALDWLMEPEGSGYNVSIKKEEMTPEQEKYAQPSANRPGYYDVQGERPRWENMVETGANLAAIAYTGYQGYNVIKGVMDARAFARGIDREAKKAADAVVKYTMKETRVPVKGLVTEQQAGWLKERDKLVNQFRSLFLQRASAVEYDSKGRLNTVYDSLKKPNIFRLVADELKAMGEVGQAIMKRPTVGQTVSFTDPRGLMKTGILTGIVENTAYVTAQGEKLMMDLHRLTAPKAEPTPTEGKVEKGLAVVGDQFNSEIIVASKKTMRAGETLEENIARTKDWISQVLSNDEASSDAELVDYFQKEGGFSKEVAEFIVSKREQVGLLPMGVKSEMKAPKTPTGEGQKPPAEPPKTAVGGAAEEPNLGKPVLASKVKGIVRQTTGQTKIGDFISESEGLSRMLSQEEKLAANLTKGAKKEEAKLLAGAMKQFFSYIKDIDKLEEQLKVEKFNSEADKVMAQQKLKVLKLVKALSKDTPENVSIEYKAMIDKIQDKFDLSRRSEKTMAQRESMRTYVERMRSEGKTIDIPAKELEMMDKTSLQEMTIDQLQSLKDEVERLETLGQTKLKARETVYKAKKDRIITQLSQEVSPINSRSVPNAPIGTTVSSWTKKYIALSNHLQMSRVGLTAIEGLADITGMQGMKRVIDKSFSNYLTYNNIALKKWTKVAGGLSESSLERIGAKLIALREGGYQRLENSGHSQKEVDAIILTPEEQAAFDLARDLLSENFPKVKDYMREVENKDVGQVENYVSFHSDTDLMNSLELYDRFAEGPEIAASKLTKQVEKGFTKKTTRTAKTKLQLNIDKVLRRHLDDVAYMLTMGKDIKMYYEIVNSPEMREKLGDTGTLAWLQYLDLMARKGGVEGAKRLQVVDAISRNIGAGVMAFRLSSALVQFSSFGDAMATIGAEWATKGAYDIAVSMEARDFVIDNFPEVAKAVGDDIAFREFNDSLYEKAVKVGMTPLQFLDGLMRSSTAIGSYAKLCKQKGIPVDYTNPDPELIAEATKMMRQSQGSSFFKDQPLALTSGFGVANNASLNKAILKFQSFMLARWDNINRQVWREGFKKGKFGKGLMAIFWILVFSVALETGIRRGNKKVLDMLKSEPKPEKESFAEDMILNAVQTVPVAGQIASSLSYSSSPVPVINAIGDVVEGASRAVKGKTLETKLKGIVQAAGSIGSLAGIPGSTTAAQVIGGAIPKGKKKSGDIFGGDSNDIFGSSGDNIF